MQLLGQYDTECCEKIELELLSKRIRSHRYQPNGYLRVAFFIPIWLTTELTRFAKLITMNPRILLIGQGLFLDGLNRILSEQHDAEIVAAVSSWEEARHIIKQENPNIVILDHDEPDLRQSDLAPLLENTSASLKVIYLTLSTNEMIIHNRQQLSDASISDLIDALQLPNEDRSN
jgi:CheY-like chemotaxis protein